MRFASRFDSEPCGCARPATHRMTARRARGARRRLAGAAVGAITVLLLAAAGARAQSNFGSVQIGVANGQAVTVSSPSGGTVANVEILTLGAGAPNSVFGVGTGASNCANAVLAAGGNCTQYVTFGPTAPGTAMGAVVLLDAGNNVLGTTYLSGIGVGGLGVLAPGNVAVVAGVAKHSKVLGDGEAATKANLDFPASVVLDGAGNMYIADSQDNRIRMVCGPAATATIAGTTCTAATAGFIETIAGDGKFGYSGDGGPASGAILNIPSSVALDGAGNLYIADTGNNVIRMISAATGNITTVAGLSQSSSICGTASDAVGDGCAATQASLDQPEGVTVDSSGNLYIADTFDHRIREVSASTGIITTIAGTGKTTKNGSGGYNGDNIAATAADLNFPYAVAFDAQGNMYIPDSANQRVREVMAVGGAITPASQIVTFAGTGNQAGNSACTLAPTPTPASLAPLSWPEGVAVDAAGNVYISESQLAAISKVNAATQNLITLVQAGCGTAYAGGVFTGVDFYGPMGLYLDGSGDLYVADYLNMVIREVQSNYVAVDDTMPPVRQGSTSGTTSQTVENDGNAPLLLTSLTVGANVAIDDTVSSACSVSTLAVDADCNIGVQFAPPATPPLTANTAENGEITAFEQLQNGLYPLTNPLIIQVFGEAEPVNATTTSITATPNPSLYGQQVAFQVTVVTGTGTGNLTGTVSITDTYNGTTTTLASGLKLMLDSGGETGTATFNTTTLGVGQHTIVATYSGDTEHFTSTSTDNSVSPLLQVVEDTTAVVLTSSMNPSAVGQSVTFTAQVNSAGPGVTPAGTVQFMDGTNALGAPVALAVTAGVATAAYTTSALINGSHAITAVYGGDAADNIEGGTSNTVNQAVQAPATIAVTSGQNPSYYGSSVTFTATITSTGTSAATGSVTFLDNGTAIGTGTLSGSPAVATFTTGALTVGTHQITAAYAGDGANSQATTPTAVSQVVNLAQTATAVTAAPSPGIAGNAETLTATTTVTEGVSTPGGTVTFSSGGTSLGSAPVGANGTAALKVTLPPASYQIVATYSGDANDAGSTSNAQALTVALATTSATVTASPSPAIIGQSITFTATVGGNGGTPTGTVNFVANGSTIGSAVLTNGTATLTDSTLAAATYSVTANYLGDSLDATSTSSPISVTVGLIPTETTLGSSTTTGSNPQVILVASVLNGVNGPMPTGTVTFNNGSTALGTATVNAGGVATLTPNLLGGTNYNITAVYSGDSTHNGSTSQVLAVSGTATDFNLSVTPAALTLKTSENGTVTVNLSSIGSFTDTIGLGCASLPTGVTCHFSPIAVSLPANGQASVQLTIDTNNPLSGGASAMNRTPGKGGAELAGVFLPCGAFLGWLMWRQRRRSLGLLTLVLVLALSAGALFATGCSGYSAGVVVPGNYTIQVTGTGANSSVTHFQNVTLTITQ